MTNGTIKTPMSFLLSRVRFFNLSQCRFFCPACLFFFVPFVVFLFVPNVCFFVPFAFFFLSPACLLILSRFRFFCPGAFFFVPLPSPDDDNKRSRTRKSQQTKITVLCSWHGLKNRPSRVAQGNFLTSPCTTQVVHLLVFSTTFWFDSRSTEADASFMQRNRLGGPTAEVRPDGTMVKHWSVEYSPFHPRAAAPVALSLDVQHNFRARR